MTFPEPFAAVEADDLLLDGLAARHQPTTGSGDPAAEALLRLARAADDAAGVTDATPGPSAGTRSGAKLLADESGPGSVRRQRRAAIASRLLVAAAASVALGLVPAAHDTRPSLPSPVLPAAPVALVRAQALVAQAQGLVAPPDVEPTTAGLDRAESLLAEATDLLDGVRDPVGGTLGVEAVRARLTGVAGALAAARHRLDSPADVVQPVRGAGSGATLPVVADRGSTRDDGATGAGSPGAPSDDAVARHDGRDDSRDDAHDDAEGDGDDRATPIRAGTSGSTGGHDAAEPSDSERPAGAGHADDRPGDDESESDDTRPDVPDSDHEETDEGSGDGSDDGAGGSVSGGDRGHESE